MCVHVPCAGMNTSRVDTSAVASVVSGVISALGLGFQSGNNSNDGIRTSRDEGSARAQNIGTRGTTDNRNSRLE